MQRALRATVVARRAGHLTKEHVGAFAAASVPEGAPIKAALDKALPKVRKCARHSRDLPAAEPWAAHLPRAPSRWCGEGRGPRLLGVRGAGEATVAAGAREQAPHAHPRARAPKVRARVRLPARFL